MRLAAEGGVISFVSLAGEEEDGEEKEGCFHGVTPCVEVKSGGGGGLMEGVMFAQVCS